MIQVKPATTQIELGTVLGLMMHEQLFGGAADDFSDRSTAEGAVRFLLSRPGYLAFIIWNDNTPVGYYFLIPWNTVCWEIHVGILPESRGEGTTEAAGQLKNIMRVLGAKTLIHHPPVFHKGSKSHARKMGMEFRGLIPKSFRKNGELHDMELWSVEL